MRLAKPRTHSTGSDVASAAAGQSPVFKFRPGAYDDRGLQASESNGPALRPV